jgi:hypothetical protein
MDRYNRQNKTARTRLPGQDGQDRITRSAAWIRQPEQNRKERTAMTGEPEQDTRTEQPTGQPEQDSQNRTART